MDAPLSKPVPSAAPTATTASAVVAAPANLSGAAVDAAFAQSPLGLRLREVLATGRGSNVAIADFLLRNPVRATAWGIEELALHTHTSTATLSRFARTVGFSGYAGLRSGIADMLQSALQPIFQPVDKLRHALQRAGGNNNNNDNNNVSESAGRHAAPHDGNSFNTPVPANPAIDAVIGESVDASLLNLQSAASVLSPAVLAAATHKILAAETVYTLGFGISAHLAAILALHIQPYCRQSINVVEFGGTEVAAGRLMNIGPRDLLIAISFPRYAADAIALAQHAKERSAHVIALTDSMASPLIPAAHDVLIAPATHPVLSSSYSAALLVIEALVTCLMLSSDQPVRQAGRLTEAISEYLYRPKKVRS